MFGSYIDVTEIAKAPESLSKLNAKLERFGFSIQEGQFSDTFHIYSVRRSRRVTRLVTDIRPYEVMERLEMLLPQATAQLSFGQGYRIRLPVSTWQVVFLSTLLSLVIVAVGVVNLGLVKQAELNTLEKALEASEASSELETLLNYRQSEEGFSWRAYESGHFDTSLPARELGFDESQPGLAYEGLQCALVLERRIVYRVACLGQFQTEGHTLNIKGDAPVSILRDPRNLDLEITAHPYLRTITYSEPFHAQSNNAY